MDQSARFSGTSVPEPEFAGDDGACAPALDAALSAYAQGRATAYDVVAELAGARLLVPVVAVLDEEDTASAGRRVEKDSHMATVSLLNPDGRRGLLAFSSVTTLRAWQKDARPVPAPARRVAQAAAHEGADAVLVDVAGPVPFPLEGPALASVANGCPWLAPHRDPVVLAALDQVCAAHEGVLSYQVADGAPSGAAVLLEVEVGRPGADPGIRQELAAALAADPVLRRSCPSGIALSVH
jgi:hypothetical protein